MPIYAYRCDSCNHAEDVLQKITDPVLTVCPSCGSSTFKKQITAAGFQLKGSGWYATDFRGTATASADTTAENADTAPAPSADKPADSNKVASGDKAHSCSPGCTSH